MRKKRLSKKRKIFIVFLILFLSISLPIASYKAFVYFKNIVSKNENDKIIYYELSNIINVTDLGTLTSNDQERIEEIKKNFVSKNFLPNNSIDYLKVLDDGAGTATVSAQNLIINQKKYRGNVEVTYKINGDNPDKTRDLKELIVNTNLGIVSYHYTIEQLQKRAASLNNLNQEQRKSLKITIISEEEGKLVVSTDNLEYKNIVYSGTVELIYKKQNESKHNSPLSDLIKTTNLGTFKSDYTKEELQEKLASLNNLTDYRSKLVVIDNGDGTAKVSADSLKINGVTYIGEVKLTYTIQD